MSIKYSNLEFPEKIELQIIRHFESLIQILEELFRAEHLYYDTDITPISTTFFIGANPNIAYPRLDLEVRKQLPQLLNPFFIGEDKAVTFHSMPSTSPDTRFRQAALSNRLPNPDYCIVCTIRYDEAADPRLREKIEQVIENHKF
jgi:hypothetical protein